MFSSTYLYGKMYKDEKMKENGSGKYTHPMLKSILLVFRFPFCNVGNISQSCPQSQNPKEVKVALRLFVSPPHILFTSVNNQGHGKCTAAKHFSFPIPHPLIIFMTQVAPRFYSFRAKLILGKRKRGGAPFGQLLIGKRAQLGTEKNVQL